MKKILILFFTLICFNSFSQELNANIYAIAGNNLIECDNSFIKNEKFVIEYKWSGKGKFNPPTFDGVRIIQESPIQESTIGSRYSSIKIINGKVIENTNNDNRKVIKTKQYQLKSSKTGRIRILPAELNVESKSIKSNSIYVNICNCKKGEYYEGNPYIIRTINKDLFLGEQTPIITKIYQSITSKRYFRLQNKSLPNINNVTQSEVIITGEWKRAITNNCKISLSRIIDHSILTSHKTGNIDIDAVKITASYYDLIKKKMRLNENISGNKLSIKVKNLPKHSPNNFYGSVGSNFSIKSEIDRTQLESGEAINYKIILRGTGNINLAETFPLEFPDEFDVIDPNITDKTFVGNKSVNGSKIFEYILIPRAEGVYTIPSFKYSYFDVNTEKYVELKTKEYKINVLRGDLNLINDSINNISKKNMELQKELNFTKISDRGKCKKYYAIFFYSIMLLIILLVLYYLYATNKTVNPINEKRRKATKIAIKRLKTANKCILNNNFEEFFEEIEKSLWGYFGQKFNVESSKLSKDNITIYFSANNIEKELEKEFIDLIQHCEFARYAPSSNKNIEMKKTLNRAIEIIIKIEITEK